MAAAWPFPCGAQVVISGRVRSKGFPMRAVFAFGSLAGSGSQAVGFRTWETEPAGWYRLSGPSGRYALLFSGPGKLMRPIILNNIYTQPGEVLDLDAAPRFDYAVFDESARDETPAKEYYQPFVAKGTSVTSVGFKLASDGVDGQGPGSQNLLVSVHRRGKNRGAPDTWEQVGPEMPVLNVDCGGVKSYDYSAGWDSGEAPTIPGETYAVRLRAESPTGRFQAYWKPRSDKTGGCYRIGEGNAGYQGRDLWMAVGSDGDGLVIPYNKRVHKEFVGETKFARKWSQTYVARGRGLAGVILYAATSGVQPGLPRQRVAVRVRKGGPKGPIVGVEKIAIGAGNYTGDASWGVFGAAFAPGEVRLTPGETYAIEFESIENLETLHGFVNIKGMVSDDNPGFHPYPKVAPDTYKQGRAYLNGAEPMDYDLDMQIIEYEADAKDWELAVEGGNLLQNGDMESGEPASESASGKPDSWKAFAIDPSTDARYIADANDGGNRIQRVIGGGANGKTADGGFVQRVEGLSRADTYRLSGRVRCSWAVDDAHQCFVGCDPTGQDQDPSADTIIWSAAMPGVHGLWVRYLSDPIRPAKDSISVWLRGRTTLKVDFPFKADFDDFAVRKVQTSPVTKGKP